MENESNEKIIALLEQIKSSPMMNGAFDKLVSSVDSLNSNMQIMMVKQQENSKKIQETHEALYDPDTGIYKRITDAAFRDKTHVRDIKELEEKSEEIEKAVEEQATKISELDSTQQSLKKVAGDRLEHLDGAIQIQKNTKKLFWTMLVAFVGVFAKEAWSFISSIV
jgi:chaperonin cofactor prefoldin